MILNPSEGSLGYYDWNPYDGWLTRTLNLWVPFSLLLLAGSGYLAFKGPVSRIELTGAALHLVTVVGLITLGYWVFTFPLEGAGSAIWRMFWQH